ncbi:MAG: DUF3025 domain-containing protein [Massilia sp.]
MLAQIDWTQPWYDSVRAAHARFGGGDLHAAFNAAASELALHNVAGLKVRFVPQDELPSGQAYEQFIGATGCVPTRENLHDFFNALVWLSFPRIKARLNALQATQIAAAGIGKSRGPARDAATIYDENSALLVVSDSDEARALVDALRAHRWHEALFERRAQFGVDAELWLFGHALMEKLVAPRKAITAHTRVIVADPGYFALPAPARQQWLDAHEAHSLATTTLTTTGFTPLPVLGVPGWWPRQDPEFYGDAGVFRPKRSAGKKQEHT